MTKRELAETLYNMATEGNEPRIFEYREDALQDLEIDLLNAQHNAPTLYDCITEICRRAGTTNAKRKVKKVTAFNQAHTPLSLSNFVGLHGDAEVFRKAMANTNNSREMIRVALDFTYLKNWSVFEETEEYTTIVSCDPLGNRRYIRVSQ